MSDNQRSANQPVIQTFLPLEIYLKTPPEISLMSKPSDIARATLLHMRQKIRLVAAVLGFRGSVLR